MAHTKKSNMFRTAGHFIFGRSWPPGTRLSLPGWDRIRWESRIFQIWSSRTTDLYSMGKSVTNRIHSLSSRWSIDGHMLRYALETISSDIRHREGWNRRWNSFTHSDGRRSKTAI